MGRPKNPNRKDASTTIAIKSKKPWADWVARFASHLGMSKADAIEYALNECARKKKFPEVAPSRFEEPPKR